MLETHLTISNLGYGDINMLPKIKLPIFSLKAPSDNREIRYRPWTVKEEKIMLIAQQGARDLIGIENPDLEKIIEATKQNMLAVGQIVNNCVIDEIDVMKMPMIDFEYVFVAIRAKSVGNVIELTLKENDEKISVDVDVENISVIRNEKHSNKIQLSDDISVIMQYPTFANSVRSIEARGNKELEAISQFETLRDCLKSVVSGDEIFDFENETEESVNEWLDDLSNDDIQKIQEFFVTAPVLRYDFPYVNQEGEEKILTIQGFDSFFT